MVTCTPLLSTPRVRGSIDEAHPLHVLHAVARGGFRNPRAELRSHLLAPVARPDAGGGGDAVHRSEDLAREHGEGQVGPVRPHEQRPVAEAPDAHGALFRCPVCEHHAAREHVGFEVRRRLRGQGREGDGRLGRDLEEEVIAHGVDGAERELERGLFTERSWRDPPART